MTARELHEKFDPLDAGLIYAERETILRALSLLASVEESQDDIVSKLRHDAKVCVRINEPGLSESLLETAAALVALKAERDALKAHAEAMAKDLEDWIGHGRYNDCSIAESQAILDAYRAAFPKEGS